MQSQHPKGTSSFLLFSLCLSLSSQLSLRLSLARPWLHFQPLLGADVELALCPFEVYILTQEMQAGCLCPRLSAFLLARYQLTLPPICVLNLLLPPLRVSGSFFPLPFWHASIISSQPAPFHAGLYVFLKKSAISKRNSCLCSL